MRVYLYSTVVKKSEVTDSNSSSVTYYLHDLEQIIQPKSLSFPTYKMGTVNFSFIGCCQIDYILCSQRWRSSIQSAKTRPGADCGSDHQLLIAKFRLKLKKVGITTRPFRYDLNQIPYDYIVKVRNRFKGLDLTESLMNYGWRFVTLYSRQESRASPWKINAKRQNGCLRRPYK